MTETDCKDSNQPIGQLFGLFGLNSDQTEDEVISDEREEEEVVNERNEELIEKSQQNNELICGQINENECIICKQNEPKYRCPKCWLKTCSLSCCKRHKTQLNCSGIRDKLGFVGKSDFSQKEFLSDYFFLEDVDRTIDNSCRQRRTIISSKYVLPKWIQKLVREARLRGINLRIMPAGFRRRKQNTTCFMYSENTINWDIEFKFIQALDSKESKNFEELLADDLVVSHSEFSCIKCRVCENTLLSDLMSDYIDSNDLIENYERNRKLLLYRNTGIGGIVVLFQTESRGSKQKYIELDLNKTLKQNLYRKTIIEFPTFFVVLNKFRHLFDIISDNKKDMETSVPKEMVNN